MFAALRSARLRFLPCFSGENRGETGALVPLLAANVGVIGGTSKRSSPVLSAEFPHHPSFFRKLLKTQNGCMLHRDHSIAKGVIYVVFATCGDQPGRASMHRRQGRGLKP
jgi:hypothetical protein